jgi:hypothetical protein
LPRISTAGTLSQVVGRTCWLATGAPPQTPEKGRAAAMLGIDFVNGLIFVGSALVVLGIFSSLIANRFGAPLLLVFLLVGMLAGQDGPGGIVFNDYQITYLIGSIALS